MPSDTDIQMLYVSGDGLFLSVMDSQIIMPIKAMEGAANLKRSLLVLTGLRHWGKRGTAARMRHVRAELPGVSIRLPFRFPLGSKFQPEIWAWQIGRSLRHAGFDDERPTIIHCRGAEAAAAASLLKRSKPSLRILLDMRGDPLDEMRFLPEKRARKVRANIERATPFLRCVDGMSAVSRRLADSTLDAFGLDGLPTIVVPCCVDTHRFFFDPAIRCQRRRELGLADKFVVCYCGSAGKYQRLDIVAEFFAAVASHEPDLHFLGITGQADSVRSELEKAGVPAAKFTLVGVPHDKVASCLMAADIGLLLREDMQTNRVASPVKFPEYLRCGLPVILTPYVGDFGEAAPEAGVGCTIDLPLDESQALAAVRDLRSRLQHEGDDYRRRCSDWAGENFSWETRISTYLDMYDRLTREGRDHSATAPNEDVASRSRAGSETPGCRSGHRSQGASEC